MRIIEIITEGLVDYQGLKIKLSKDSDGVAVRAFSSDSNRELGTAELFFDDEGRLDPQTLWVDKRFHGQGIAKAMYDYLKSRGYTVIRSWDQTDAGKGFWDKHRGPEVTVWENDTKHFSAAQVWNYVKKIHPTDQQGGGFLKSLVVAHPQWELRQVPLNQIHIPDPHSEDELEDPYDRVLDIDMSHVRDITVHDIKNRPIVIDANGVIIDGNHRALAAGMRGMSTIPAYVPV